MQVMLCMRCSLDSRFSMCNCGGLRSLIVNRSLLGTHSRIPRALLLPSPPSLQVARAILEAKNVPYLVAAPLLLQDIPSWQRDGVQGLQSVVLYSLPELDGAIDAVPLGGLVGNGIHLVRGGEGEGGVCGGWQGARVLPAWSSAVLFLVTRWQK